MADTTAPQSDELRRFEALHRYGILGAPSEDIFDSITATAAAVCEAPIGVISLIESDRLWFLSRSGIDLRETLRSNTFCDYVIANADGLTEILDASTDARFNSHPLVVENKVRFYAGMPLCTLDGYALGTLCVLSDQPRSIPLSESQRATLAHLASLIMLLLEHRINSPANVIGRAVESALPTGVLIADPRLPGCPITFCNKGYEQITGYSFQDIVGKECRFLDGKDTNKKHKAELQDAMKNGRLITTVLKNYKKDGTEFWNEITLSPVKDGNDKLMYWLAFQYDVTARINALEELKSSHEGLKKAVLSQTEVSGALAKSNSVLLGEISQRRELEHQSSKLRNDLVHISRLTTMGEMATGLAHQLNQPLLAISQCADTALLAAEENSGPELFECINDIQSETQRAGEIIRSLRQFSSRDTSRREAVDINELTHQAIRITRSDTRALNISIELEEGAIPEIYVDSVQIAQVLVNLLRNSVDAILSINNDAVEFNHSIQVKTNFVNNEILISVTDTGPGFDADIEPFKAFESSKENGMGIGLSISRTIVESHDGRLWIEKNNSDGCTVAVALPITPKER